MSSKSCPVARDRGRKRGQGVGGQKTNGCWLGVAISHLRLRLMICVCVVEMPSLEKPISQSTASRNES